jgi:hypothetical protein
LPPQVTLALPGIDSNSGTATKAMACEVAQQLSTPTFPDGMGRGERRGSADRGVKGVFDPLSIFLPPSIRF